MVVEHAQGIRATRAETGTRFFVNLGCLLSLESGNIQTQLQIARNLDVRRMTEFGANHSAFEEIANLSPTLDNEAIQQQTLSAQLNKHIDVLDLTDWQKEKLRELNLCTVEQVLQATEEDLQQAYGIGEKKSRRMKMLQSRLFMNIYLVSKPGGRMSRRVRHAHRFTDILIFKTFVFPSLIRVSKTT
jgi:hypothetical protein